MQKPTLKAVPPDNHFPDNGESKQWPSHFSQHLLTISRWEKIKDSMPWNIQRQNKGCSTLKHYTARISVSSMVCIQVPSAFAEQSPKSASFVLLVSC